jgi:protein ImuA
MEHPKNAMEKNALIGSLRSQIMALQGYRASVIGGKALSFGLGPVEAAFPHGVIPGFGMHEFVSFAPEQAAATSGFMTALASHFMKNDGICLWVSRKRTIYPAALSYFGVAPDRVVFIDLKRDKDLLWTIEEALKCTALSAVIGEVKDLTLTESRRLQLAVENSKIAGFLHRVNPRLSNPIAAICRWQITPLPSGEADGLPGMGFPKWQVTIAKVRNGQPGSWRMKWNEDYFEYDSEPNVMADPFISKVG